MDANLLPCIVADILTFIYVVSLAVPGIEELETVPLTRRYPRIVYPEGREAVYLQSSGCVRGWCAIITQITAKSFGVE